MKDENSNKVMIHVIIWLAIFAGYYFYRVYKACVEAKEEEEDRFFESLMNSDNQVKQTNMEETISTRQLALKTIENIGSTPQYTEEGRIQFEYQGITFLMEATNDCAFVNLIWPWCHYFSKFDIDEFARVQRVVNDINARGVVSVFYGETDSDDVAVHIRKNFLFVSQIPELNDYLKLILDNFFRTVRTLDVEIEKCRLQECEQ